jgi:hypothetical protein
VCMRVVVRYYAFAFAVNDHCEATSTNEDLKRTEMMRAGRSKVEHRMLIAK